MPAIFFGNLSPALVVFHSSSGHRPPAALLSNIGPARIPSPPSKRAGPFCTTPERLQNMTSFRAILLALLASVLLTGCHTIKGAGRDTASVGAAGWAPIDSSLYRKRGVWGKRV